ncbi:cysteine--tRNA ligase [Nanoarchaeota archaeon]
MPIKFFNTLTRKKEEFKPIKEGEVKLYTCGPTVYNFVHIGNLRTYVFEDLLRRFLEYKGLKVIQVMNITDIEDKTIRDSGKEGISLKDFAERYTAEFYKDVDTLNIKRAHHYPKATDYVDKMVEITKKLVEKGFAYIKSGSVYYDISKFPDYGKLAHIDTENLKAGARVDVDEYDKDNPMDFVLMKRSTLDELKRGIFYETEWGKVRPGWHIECSAMSMELLGEQFDMHTGGVDNMFPHHENEIAQSEAYTGKKFVNYWLHSEHLIVEGKKMSKSLGNFYTLRDLLVKGFKPKAIRYLLISTHYKQQLNFTFEGLKAAEASVERLLEFIRNLKNVKEGNDNPEINKLIEETKNKFESSLDDDLGISGALGSIFEFITKINKLIQEKNISDNNAKDILTMMKDFDKILGVLEEDEQKIPEEIIELAEKRQQARNDKNWEESDKIRDELKEKGYEIKDSKEGYRIQKI